MPWEPYQPIKHRKSLKGSVSVTKTSMTIAGDVSEHYFWDKKMTRCLMMFNKEECLAALKPTQDQGLKIRSTGRSKAISLQAKSFIAKYGIAPRAYTLTWEKDMLIFEPDLTKPLEEDDEE